MKDSMPLVDLFYLITHADGVVSEKETELGLLMAKSAGPGVEIFNARLVELSKRDKGEVLTNCIESLKKLNQQEQINILAWTAVAANSDGFMSGTEWALIYKIYHTELGLKLNEIMDRQKEIHRTIYNRSFVAMGIRVNN